MDALIFAGAPNDGDLKEESDAPYEALIKIKNRPMVQYVVRAFQEMKTVRRTAVVGPTVLENAVNGDVHLIEAEGSFLDNVMTGIKELKPAGPVLLSTADIPLVTGRIIQDFVDACRKVEADIFYPMISRRINSKKYPDVQRTYVSLKEGEFTGGNILIMKPEVLQESFSFIKKILLWRKSPWKIARLLGPKIIFKYILRIISMKDIENRIQHIMGCRGSGIIIEHPEIGFDIDKPEDLELIRSRYI